MFRGLLKSIVSERPVDARFDEAAMPGNSGLRTRGSRGKRAMPMTVVPRT